jgi:hypothetical protein
MSKSLAFIALTVVAVVAGIVGSQRSTAFFSDIWSQIFWLAIGTLATVFILESILERANQARRIKNDAFAFRTFAANMLDALLQMVGHRQRNQKLGRAALEGDKIFSAETITIADTIRRSEAFEPHVYLKYYLDVSNGLRDLARNYIRLYSANQSEMLSEYQELNDLASHWEYRGEFEENARHYAESLESDNPDKLKREQQFDSEVRLAKEAIVSTATKLSELAARSAAGKRYYE